MNTVPETQVIAIAKQNLQLSTDNYDNFFSLKIQEKLNNLNSPSITSPNLSQVVEICDNSFENPKGAKSVWAILLCNQPTNQYGTQNVIFDANSLFLVEQSLFGQIVGINGYKVGGTIGQYAQLKHGTWYFNTIIEEPYAQVWYRGQEMDEYGSILIPDSFQYAIADAITADFLRSNPTYFNNDFNATRTLRIDYSRTSELKLKQAIGADRLDKFEQDKPLLAFATNKIRMSGSILDNYTIYT